MWIDGPLASHLLHPQTFTDIKAGDLVFVFRQHCYYLDGICRPEVVTKVSMSGGGHVIHTRTGMRFRQCDGRGSPSARRSRHLRIARYTPSLQVALSGFYKTRKVLQRIANLDLSGLVMTLTEAEALEHLLTKYAERKIVDEGKYTRKGRVPKGIRKGLIPPPQLRTVQFMIYRPAAGYPGVIRTLLDAHVEDGDVIAVAEEDDRWYRLTPQGKLYEIDMPVHLGIRLERAVKCRRLVKELTTMTSL